MRRIVTQWLRRFLIAGILCSLLGIGFSVWVGSRLIAPAPSVIGPPPALLGGETVGFESDSGSQIAGWLTESEDAYGAVLLLHAIRSNRTSMVERARFLRDEGYHTLCIDLQAHGESTGKHITFGHLEARDAAAGVSYLRDRYDRLPVAVMGTSLGGAAALMADYDLPPEAMVVEAVFSDVDTAISNRLEMRLGKSGRTLSPLLAWQIRPRLGVWPRELSPLRSAKTLSSPVLMIYGAEDEHARPTEGHEIHQAFGGAKEFWEIPGASHIDFHYFAGTEYERRVSRFMATHLHAPKD